MKTAGGTFRRQIRANFEPGELYPWPRLEDDLYVANTNIPFLLGLPPERKARARVFMGHFPYAVVEHMGLDLVTMTILRDPVTRTLSYLKHAIERNEQHRTMRPEEVYEDSFEYLCYIRNHQTKIFSIGPEDDFQTYMENITIDDRRLEIAKENLAKIDVLGLTEHFDEFCRTMETDYGWKMSAVGNKNVSEEAFDVPDSFISRIREDNAMDVAFYDHAVKLWTERRS